MNHHLDDLRALLARVDDPVDPQFPGGFKRWNEAKAEARFLAVVQTLAERLGCPALPDFDPIDLEQYRLLWQETLFYESGRAILDASFHAQISLPRPLLSEKGRDLNYILRLRVSNFGDLATVYDDDTMLEPAALAIIRQALEEHGYVYVSTALLLEPYTGQNPGVSGFRDWGMRYFDWI